MAKKLDEELQPIESAQADDLEGEMDDTTDMGRPYAADVRQYMEGDENIAAEGDDEETEEEKKKREGGQPPVEEPTE